MRDFGCHKTYLNIYMKAISTVKLKKFDYGANSYLWRLI